MDLKQLCYKLGEIILSTDKEVCSIIVPDNKKKQTGWWNQRVRNEIKKLRKQCGSVISANEKQNKATLVKRAKQKSREELGKHLESGKLFKKDDNSCCKNKED